MIFKRQLKTTPLPIVAALRGIGFALYLETHMRLHLVFAVIVLGIGYYLSISPSEWLMLLTAIFVVVITEMINTSIEKSIDLFTKKKRYRAMVSKDIAAGAVLLASIYACLVGLIIFVPKLFLLTGG
jgi:diacylglycerol kinase